MVSSLFSRPGPAVHPGDFPFGAQQQQAQPYQQAHHQTQEQLQHQPQPQHRQAKLKSISSFFHPFSHTATASGSAGLAEPDPQHHIISYHRASIDNPLGMLRNQSHRLGSNISSPKNASTASLPLQVSLSSSHNSPSLVSAMPSTMGQSQNGKGVSMTSATLQAQVKRGMPTLASAIHIPDFPPSAPIATYQAATSASFVIEGVDRNRGRDPSTERTTYLSGVHPLYHANASSTSLSGSYVHIPAEGLQRFYDSDLSADEDSATQGPNRGRSDSNASHGTLKRRLSRRLSLENIIPKITGSLRKRDRSAGKGESDRRWSITNGFTSNTNLVSAPVSRHGEKGPNSMFELGGPPIALESRPKVMGIPATRIWRNKFTVPSAKTGTGGLTAASKIDLVGRQARVGSRNDLHESTDQRVNQRYDERTIRRVPVRGRESMATLSGMSMRAKERARELEKERKANEPKPISQRRVSIASSIDPAATPKSIPSAKLCPSPAPIPGDMTATFLAASADIPNIHTPMAHLRHSALHIPGTSRDLHGGQLFSPAQDDMSILDPARSPMPLPDASPTMPGVVFQTLPLPSSFVNQVPRQVDEKRRLSSISPTQISFAAEDISTTIVSDSVFNLGSLGNGLAESTQHQASRTTVSSEILSAPAQANFSLSQSSQTWHAVQEVIPRDSSSAVSSMPSMPTSSSSRTLYTLPRSKSKSHTDLSSFASGKNLVEHLENTQGPGWWSADKRLTKYSSTRTLSAGKGDNDDKIRELERLAKTTCLSYKTRFDDVKMEQQLDTAPSPSPFPSTARYPKDLAQTSLGSESDSGEDTPTKQPVRRVSDDLISQTESPSKQNPARPSMVAGSTWGRKLASATEMSPRRIALSRQSALSMSQQGVNAGETPNKLKAHLVPLPATEPRQAAPTGLFISNRISPDIARRASFLNRGTATTPHAVTPEDVHRSPSRSASRQTLRSTLSTSTAPDSLTSGSEEETEQSLQTIQVTQIQSTVEKLQLEAEARLAALRSRHTLELDAVLSALSAAKGENKTLKEELGSLTTLLVERVQEREKLKATVESLVTQLQQMKLDTRSAGMTRSDSTNGSLLPELDMIGCPSPLREISSGHISPGPPNQALSGGADEFGSRPLPALPQLLQTQSSGSSSPQEKDHATSMSAINRDRRIVSKSTIRSISGSGESNVLYDPEDDEDETSRDEWTLKLKEADEKYLDDL